MHLKDPVGIPVTFCIGVILNIKHQDAKLLDPGSVRICNPIIINVARLLYVGKYLWDLQRPQNEP